MVVGVGDDDDVDVDFARSMASFIGQLFCNCLLSFISALFASGG